MTCSLNGVRVLDLSRVLAGPWATQLLADLGADVIKIERPGSGDDTRAWGPPFVGGEGGAPRQSAYFLCTNRAKRSVCVDLASAEGQQIIRELASQSDVLVENFRVGGLARYGLGYPALKQEQPGLIYCSITGYGQTGPYRDRASYDFITQGLGGLMSITGQPDCQAGAGPMKVGVALVDIITGLYAATAILAALHHRSHTGEGQHIDLALLDCLVASLANQASSYLVSGKNPDRIGNAHPSIVPYQVFSASDGEIILAVGNDEQFKRFCTTAGCPELCQDPRYETNAQRVLNRTTLIPILQQIIRTRSRAQWIEALLDTGVPAGPINSLSEVFADLQVQHRSLAVTLQHHRLGTLPGVACPIRLSSTPVTYEQAPPLLGEHTGEVLTSLLGRTKEQIAALNARGVIGCA